MGRDFDFSGYATRNDLLCGDGRIIRKDAFKHCDGQTVPLIWNHDHTKSDAVIGHAILENREDGVYAYCKLNDTKAGLNAKAIVEHGDVRSLSIYANKLKQLGNEVIHGTIRELSLVLAGANPGAFIDFVMAHDDDGEDALYANYDENAIAIYHSEDNEEKGEPKMEEKQMFTKEQEELIHGMISQAVAEVSNNKVEEVVEVEEELQHAEAKTEEKEKTVKEVYDSLSEEQQMVVNFLIGEALKENNVDEDEKGEGGKTDMKHNVFDSEINYSENVLSHSEMKAIFEDAKRCGSLKEAIIQHGIEDIELLFPDHKSMENEPGFIKRNDDWVAKVLGGVHHTPFSRIKSIFADITKDQARAKGYTKGNLKVEEVFKLLKRTTNPTTVYKKQKLDRDDMLDITEFDVLPWLKREIRMMLNEELARAFLIGDGRNPVDEADDKIDEECIRPIWKMEDLFTVKTAVSVPENATEEDKAKAFIKACVKSRKHYKGSGNPVMFMSEDMLTDCMLIEDSTGRRIYDDENKLRAALRVSEIIPVPVMEGDAVKRTDDKGTFELAALYLNLKDYNVGTDKGGEINFFDDFDIDYNQHKYLMETRCSGTLTKPYSAVAIEFKLA